MDKSTPAQGGILFSARQLAHSLLQAFQTRLSLFSLEVREETKKIVLILVLTFSALFFVAISLVMIPLALIFTFFESKEVALTIFWAFTIIYFIMSIVIISSLRSVIKTWHAPFQETLHQIQKDARWVQPEQ